MFCLLLKSLNVICAGWSVWVVSAHGLRGESHCHGGSVLATASIPIFPALDFAEHSHASSEKQQAFYKHLCYYGNRNSALFYLRRYNFIKRWQQRLHLSERWTCTQLCRATFCGGSRKVPNVHKAFELLFQNKLNPPLFFFFFFCRHIHSSWIPSKHSVRPAAEGQGWN